MLTMKQNEDEWLDYESVMQDVVKRSGLNKTLFYDLRGNHDNYGVPSVGSPLDFFSKYSINGQLRRTENVNTITVEHFLLLDLRSLAYMLLPYFDEWVSFSSFQKFSLLRTGTYTVSMTSVAKTTLSRCKSKQLQIFQEIDLQFASKALDRFVRKHRLWKRTVPHLFLITEAAPPILEAILNFNQPKPHAYL